MLTFTVLLLVPDTLASTFGHDLYTEHVSLPDTDNKAAAVQQAIAQARDAAMDAYNAWDDGIEPDAFHTLAVFDGLLHDIKP